MQQQGTPQPNHSSLYPDPVTVEAKSALGPTDGLGVVGVQEWVFKGP